jgi:AbiU2
MKNLCECDVEDKESLAVFRNKIRRWCQILTGDDIHSIFNQIQDMVWNDTVYRTFNEARRLSEETNDPSTGLPGTVIELLDLSFLMSQTMAIRRLTDSHEWRPERAVYSLPSLIEEIKESKAFFSRENYVCYDGIPFEGDKLQHPQDLVHSSRHSVFDLLSGTDKDHRNRYDKINEKIFKELQREISKTDLIRAYSNKFVAHAAAPDNRRKIDPELKRLSLQYIEKSYKAIITVGKHLERLTGATLIVELATPQFDQLKSWDKPTITSIDKEKLYSYWKKRGEMFEGWQREL